MTKIVISDTHLGSPNATLSDFDEFKRVLKEANNDLEEIILLGDIVDLWVKTLPEALKIALPFFRAIGELRPEKVVYVPGNHDHHFKVMGEEELTISEPSHSYPSSFLKDIPPLRKILEKELDADIEVRYPIYDLNGLKIYLTHGHYFDRMQVGLTNLSIDAMKFYSEDLVEELALNEFLSSIGLDAKSISLSVRSVSLSEVERYFDWLYESLYRNSLYPELVTAERTSWNVITLIRSPLLFIYRKLGRKPLATVADRAIRIVSEITQSEPHAIIFGHTHRPGIVLREDNIVMNCGAWVKGKGSFIAIEDNYAELREYESVDGRLLLKRSKKTPL